MIYFHPTDTSILIDMIYRMISIIRYDNEFAFRLMREVTLGKKAFIRLDESWLSLQSSGGYDDYKVVIFEEKPGTPLQFATSSLILRKIMSGIITIDQAVVSNELYVAGSLDDILRIYRLTTCLLAQGPLNEKLRLLWEEFNETWHNDQKPLPIKPLEKQKPAYGFLLDHIPEKVLLTNP